MEYIDAKKLRSEVERIKESGCESPISICNEILMFIDYLQQEHPNLDNIKREWYNKGYLKGRQDAHIPARELGLPKAFDFKPLDEDLEQPDMDSELEKEIDSYYGIYRKDGKTYDIEDGEECVDWKEMFDPYNTFVFASHFYELGKLNTRKEEKQCQKK